MNPLLTILASLVGAGSVATIVVSKLFDVKLEKLRNEREIQIAKVESEADVVVAQGKEAVQTIVAANHALKDEVERLTKRESTLMQEVRDLTRALKECQNGKETTKLAY